MDTKGKVYEKTADNKVGDFLLFYTKAYRRNNIKALIQLHERFPEISERAFDEYYIECLSDPADYEYRYRHPILIDSNRMTQNRVLDMVAYLFSKHEAPDEYKNILTDRIAFHDVFNFQLERYQRDYDKTALWDCFFTGLPELRYIIEQRNIHTLDELIYRASSYFESYR